MANAPLFPFSDIKKFFRDRINAIVSENGKSISLDHLEIRYCHYDAECQYAPWAGFRDILEEVQIAAIRGEYLHPYLIFGVHSSFDSIPENEYTAVLDWPGIKYLRYDIDDAGLLTALQSCLAHCSQPLPPRLQVKQTPQDLLKLLSTVRHQFEGEINLVEDRMEHLRMVMNGATLRLSHASVAQAFTEAQRKDLLRLSSYLTISLALAPEIEGLKPIEIALQSYRQQWQDVIVLASALPDGDQAAVHAALEGWRRILQTIEKLINSVQILERAIKGLIKK